MYIVPLTSLNNSFRSNATMYGMLARWDNSQIRLPLVPGSASVAQNVSSED